MDNIEQIKQERDKLQERLNNAAKFFREQKAQIETLTKENEELKNKKKEITLDSSEEVIKENSEQNLNEAYEELCKKYQELKEFNEADLKRYNELEDNYEGLQNKYKELETQFKEQRDGYENKITSLEEDNLKLTEDAKLFDECAKKLSNTEESYEQLKKKYITRKEQEATLLGKVEEQDKEIEKLNGDYLELKGLMATKEQFNKTLQDTYNEVYAELNELKETNKNNVNAYEELKDKFDKLNNKYDDLENEKLAWEADYKNLEDKFKSIKEDSEINKEIEQNLTDTLFEIRELVDNILNPMPAPEQLKEKMTKGEVTMIQNKQTTNKDAKSEMIIENNNQKRIGSEFETKNEVMSI